jgi:class 3 adenylate cyclase/tetratricopeptide (TPR) repeat protein
VDLDVLRGRLAALLPRSVWPLVSGRAEGRSEEGCVLFADLAGFTALTESLARIGKEGAEELTRILNAFFSAMIGVAHGEGGDVLRFGGDAITVFFPGGLDGGLRAAAGMQARAGRFTEVATRGGTFCLAMKIGVSKGKVLLGTVGDEGVGRDYFSAGRALDEAAEAEHHAARGEVVLSPSCSGAAERAGWSLSPLDGGFARLLAGTGAGEGLAPGALPAAESPELSDLEEFLPPFVVERARLETGLAAAEHRRTSVLFLSFAGLDYDGDSRILDKVSAVYAEVSALVRLHGGWVNKLDMGDKGSKMIALFGAPRALEHPEEAACRAALQILESQVLRGLLADLRVGVTSAPLFAAYVGNEERREFTVMGDGINMAARLMANAHSWRVLCDAQVREKAGGRLAFRALDPIFVKGKKEKVPIFRPEGEHEETEEEGGAFVGRAGLLEELPRLLSDPGGPSALALVGPPGVGKSALVHRVGLDLDAAGVRRLTVPLSPHSAHGYLSAFRPVLFSALGVSRSAPDRIKAAALGAAFPPEDAPYLPLFGEILACALLETPEVKALGPKDRKDVLFAMAQRLLLGLASEGPYVLALDGLENADAASLELLEGLLPGTAEVPLKVLASFREGAPDRLGALFPPDRTRRVEPLSPEEIRDFLIHAAGAAPPPEAFLEFLGKKTGGNPKFLEQILRAMEDQGLLKPGPSGLLEVDEDRLARAKFPDTLEGILLSRADGLPEAERHLLKTASILGTSFSLNLLARLSEREGETVVEGIRSLEGRGFVRMDSWGARPYATFADALLRDALYESLTFESRRALHGRAARFLEADAAGDRRVWPALARHFEAASEAEPALKYLGLCAEEARARYDNTAAFDFLSRLVALQGASGASPGPDAAYRRGLLHLAESAKDLGRLEEAEALSRKILEGVPEPCEETVVSLMRLADIERRRGNLERSLELDEEAMRRCGSLSDPVLDCRILLDSGVGHAMAGRFDEALTRFKKAERLARRAGTPNWQVLALMNQGLCQYHSGGNLLKAYRLLAGARRVADKNNLRPQMANIAVNSAQLSLDLGRYEEALRAIGRATVTARQFGYRHLLAGLEVNASLAEVMIGEWTSATVRLKSLAPMVRQFKMTHLQGVLSHTQGILAAIRGDFKEALQLQAQAFELHQALGNVEGMQGCVGESLILLLQLQIGPGSIAGMDRVLIRASEEASGNGADETGIRSLWNWLQCRKQSRTFHRTWQEMRCTLDQAIVERKVWLTAELAEMQIRFLIENGKVQEATILGLRVYPALRRHFSPPKTGAFLLSYVEALQRIRDFKAAQEVLGQLSAYRKTLDRGLLGLRYRLLLGEASCREGRLRSAGFHARLARRIADAVEALQTDPVFREAYKSLPEVARLRGLEERLGRGA